MLRALLLCCCAIIRDRLVLPPQILPSPRFAMHFQRLGAQNDRRRRLLAEEVPSSSDHSATSDVGPTSPAQRYHGAAQLDQQARITDFVPTRKRVLLALFAVGLLFIGIALGVHQLSQTILPATIPVGELKLSVLNLNGSGNLAGWFASMLMLTTGAMAVVIYVLRRHRLDDYRARYRVWLWSALACFVMSVDEVANLHDDFQAILVHFTHWSGPLANVAWWLGIWSVVLAVISVRLWFEIRDSRWSVAMLSFSVGFWLANVALRMGWVPMPSISPVIAMTGARLLGHLCFWLTIGIYGRHLIFDIEGKLPVRPIKVRLPKIAKKKTASSANQETDEDEPQLTASGGKKIIVDPAHRKADSKESQIGSGNSKRTDLGPHFSPSTTSRPALTLGSSNNDLDDQDEDSESNGRNLSRAERRKLRRQK